jgi:hypothetical protein
MVHGNGAFGFGFGQRRNLTERPLVNGARSGM